jgi:hypothetical protein
MEKAYRRWKRQLDEFDAAVDALPTLEQGMQVWGAFAPALPALFDAVLRERTAYKATASELRRWMDEHDKEMSEPVEFGERLRSTIDGARRLKGLMDALYREKAVAETAYPEMAGGSLKDTGAIALGAAADVDKVVEPREIAGNHERVAPQVNSTS